MANPYDRIIALDAEELRAALIYVPETGDLIWRKSDRPATRPWFNPRSGKHYRYMDWKGQQVRAHRVAWCIFHGEMPTDKCIDHLNGNGLDNRIANLRLVDIGENAKNQRRPKDNTSGRIGVSWRKDCEKFQALGKVDGKRVHLGYFETIGEAAAARDAFERLHGYHENHGQERPL